MLYRGSIPDLFTNVKQCRTELYICSTVMYNMLFSLCLQPCRIVTTLHDDCEVVYKIIKLPSTSTVLPQIMARVLISFQELFTPVTKRDQRLYETDVYYLKF